MDNKPVKKAKSKKMAPPLKQQNNTNNMNEFEQGVANMGGKYKGEGLTLLNIKEEDKEKKVVAVIVSFVSQASYDQLFTSVEQKSDEGSKVLVYSCDSSYLKEIQLAFEGQTKDETAIQMIKHIKQLDPDCVVFNWECSAGYGSKTFPENPQVLFKFLKMIIDMGFMAMFSDFSLKSLINNWKQQALGPNPFILHPQEHSGSFQLNFESQILKNCPSAQLQVVGEMAEGGKCNVHTLPGTIIYSLNPNLVTQAYELQLLTIAKGPKVTNKEHLSTIGQNSGTAGHVLLKYKSGGCLLTSMGHWIELMKVDTSEKKLFEIAQREYGQVQSKKMRAEFQQLGEVQRKEYVKKKAVTFVQNQAPCESQSRKMKKKM